MVPDALTGSARDAWAQRLAATKALPLHDANRKAAWAELAELVDGVEMKLDFMGTAGNFSFDLPPFEFGKSYVALQPIGLSPGHILIDKGEIVRFTGWGCLPYDNINDYCFERLSGAPVNLTFEPLRGDPKVTDVLIFPDEVGSKPWFPPDVKPTIAFHPFADERTQLLDAVGELLWRVRKAAKTLD